MYRVPFVLLTWFCIKITNLMLVFVKEKTMKNLKIFAVVSLKDYSLVHIKQDCLKKIISKESSLRKIVIFILLLVVIANIVNVNIKKIMKTEIKKLIYYL